MTAIYYDTNADAVVIAGIDVYQPRTLTAALGPDGITVVITSLAGRGEWAGPWSVVTDGNGAAFGSTAAVLAYLAGLFTLDRPIGATATGVAATAVNGHRALMFDASGSGAVLHADPASPDYVFAGLSTGAAPTGAAVTTITAGLVVEPSWNWEPLQPVYVGASGVPTQAAPEVGLFHLLGFAATATSLLLAPAPLVYLA